MFSAEPRLKRAVGRAPAVPGCRSVSSPGLGDGAVAGEGYRQAAFDSDWQPGDEVVVALTLISDLPATVVGVEAHEKVTAEDYENVLVPAVHAAEAASSNGKVTVLFVVGRDSQGFTTAAVWEDAKLALGQRHHWDRVAVVDDGVWVRRAIKGLGWAMPGQVRAYPQDELEDAQAWATSPRRLSGARRFFADMIIGWRVLNELRHRTMKALFGVDRGWSSNVTAILLVASAVDGIHRASAAPRTQVRKVRASPDTPGNTMIAAAAVKEVIDALTTPKAKATTRTAGLIVFALVVHSIRPTVARLRRAIRSTVRSVITGVREVPRAISRYGAQIKGVIAEPAVDGSPSRADRDGQGAAGSEPENASVSTPAP